MVIGVIADTHDNLPMMQRAVTLLRARGVDVLLHAGDYVAPFALELLMSAGMPLIGIFGNNDGEREGLRKISADIFQGPYRFELGGRTVIMAHEPEALAEAVSPDDDLAICGHTHQPEVSVGPPLTVNPGEVGGWLYGHATGAIVDLRELTAEVVEFGRQQRPCP